jgi:hypothetical protein
MGVFKSDLLIWRYCFYQRAVRGTALSARTSRFYQRARVRALQVWRVRVTWHDSFYKCAVRVADTDFISVRRDTSF